jgi:hypothetical protein
MDKIKRGFNKVTGKLTEKKAASFFTEHATAILITIVIGVIILTAMVLLFKDTIIPHLESLIEEIFTTE